MLLFVAAMTAGAQNDKAAAINEKFFQAKVSEVAQRLEMTDEQRAKFEPVYRRYNNEMRALWGRHPKRHRSEYGQREPLTDEQKLQLTKRRMERQQQAQAIRLKYIDEFATVLTAQQVSRFYDVEGQIQKKLMDRRRHHHHDGKPTQP
jgi:Spy/CpxP family protein refolding chaperone